MDRKKLFDLMEDEEFMYKMKLGDYKYVFEYDSIEELKEQMALTKATHKEILEEEYKYKQVNNAINVAQENAKNEETKTEKLTFSILEVEFLAYLKNEEIESAKKLSESSYKAYANTFNKLKVYFEDDDINNIVKDRFRAFRDYLVKDLKLKANTTNIQMIYTSKFLDVACDKDLLLKNEAKKVRKLEEHKLEKEHFTKLDLKNIFEYDKYSNETYNKLFKILAYSGMRVSELHSLTNEDIKQDENEIYYYQIDDGKTENSKRKVPIHKDILSMVLEINFPISIKTTNAFNKEMLKELYKVIEKKSTKSLHTFRANFIGECINNFSKELYIIQEISGHSLSDSENLTINTYGKGFKMKNKKEIVDSVKYV